MKNHKSLNIKRINIEFTYPMFFVGGGSFFKIKLLPELEYNSCDTYNRKFIYIIWLGCILRFIILPKTSEIVKSLDNFINKK